MKNITLLGLVLAVFTGCFKEPQEGSSTIHQTTPNCIYESGDLGAINVLGCPTDAKARFTMEESDYPLAVKVFGNYVPSMGTSPAVLEVLIYDTLADQNPNNDVLIGALSPSSPWSRARLDHETPGGFTVVVPIGAASNLNLEDHRTTHRTIGIVVRISTSSWYGTIPNWKVSVITMAASKISVPNSFLRDN